MRHDERMVRGYNSDKRPSGKEAALQAAALAAVAPRKTIFVQPDEAMKLTASELKPKQAGATDKLVYFLVSDAPKYGMLFR